MENQSIRAFRRLLRRFEQQTERQADNCCGVSVPQCLALTEIEYLGKSSLKQLSQNLQLDASTMSRTVDSLVNLGLVQRSMNPEDRRYLELSLTKKGQQTCDQINAESDSFYRQVFQAIPEDRRKEILDAFEIFVEAMGLANGSRVNEQSGA